MRAVQQVGSVLLEATRRSARFTIYGRAERTLVETEILLFPEQVHVPHPGELVDPVGAFTAGGIRDLLRVKGVLMGVGADTTFYAVPPLLKITHGEPRCPRACFCASRPRASAAGCGT